MPNYTCQSILASATGNTEDVQVNTFAVNSDDEITAGEIEDWGDAIIQFYEDCKNNSAMRGRAQVGHLLKFYAADTSVPNYPIAERSWSFAAAVGTLELPNEISLCVSYANTVENAVPRARRRGRIYISGWSEARNDTGRPVALAVSGLANNYATYAGSVYDITGVSPGVWSRVNAAVYPINTVWVDNEWDTMRSRGGKSTGRSTVAV
jgi:hypothetical protein